MKQLKTNDFYSNNRRNNKFCKLDGYCTCYGNRYKFNGNYIDKDNTINDNNKSINSPKDIDHIPLKDLIFRPSSELFSLRKQCLIDYETSKFRKNWLCNVIEMKYRNDINNLLEEARKYFDYRDKI